MKQGQVSKHKFTRSLNALSVAVDLLYKVMKKNCPLSRAGHYIRVLPDRSKRRL